MIKSFLNRFIAFASVAAFAFGSESLHATPTTSLLRIFYGTRGATPMAGIVFGPDGALYGTTEKGGANGYGTIFKLAPPKAPATEWTETVLHDFQSADGAFPEADLTIGQDGALYGTTFGYGPAGENGRGTVFKLLPPVPPAKGWTYVLIQSFRGSESNNGQSYSGVVFGPDGALYATTPASGASGHGIVYKLTPPVPPAKLWEQTYLHSFRGAPTDGSEPYSEVVFGRDGAIYGATAFGGQSQQGIIYKLTPPTAPSTNWIESILHQFPAYSGDASNPCGVTFGPDGALYGATSDTKIFRLAPPESPATAWSETVIAQLPIGRFFVTPCPNIVSGSDGSLYGVVPYAGGNPSMGIVFKVSPPAQGGTQWTSSVLHTFTGGPNDGSIPYGRPVIGSGGTLYGTTSQGGTQRGVGTGVAFKVQF